MTIAALTQVLMLVAAILIPVVVKLIYDRRKKRF